MMTMDTMDGKLNLVVLNFTATAPVMHVMLRFLSYRDEKEVYFNMGSFGLELAQDSPCSRSTHVTDLFVRSAHPTLHACVHALLTQFIMSLCV